MLGIVFVFVALFVVLPQVLKYLVMAGVMPSEVLIRLIYSVYAGRGILIGLVLGYALYRAFRKNRTAETAEKA